MPVLEQMILKNLQWKRNSLEKENIIIWTAYYSAKEKERKEKHWQRDRERKWIQNEMKWNQIKCGYNQVNKQQVKRYTAVYAAMHIKHNNNKTKMSYCSPCLFEVSKLNTQKKKIYANSWLTALFQSVSVCYVFFSSV